MGAIPVPQSSQGTQWYNYPADSPGGGYGELLDPWCSRCGCCNYLKPDTNIAIPQGTPITALLPGKVTDVTDHGGGAGGLSVVVKLDQPLNNEATHVAYNFLGGSNVAVGQHVGAGQIIGRAGSPYGINFALALTPDDTWGGAHFNLNAKGDPNLDPRRLLAAVRSGTPVTPWGGGTYGQNSPVAGCGTFDIGCQLTQFFNSMGQQISNAGEKVAIFAIALTLIILGFYLMMHREVNTVAVKGAEAAVIA